MFLSSKVSSGRKDMLILIFIITIRVILHRAGAEKKRKKRNVPNDHEDVR